MLKATKSARSRVVAKFVLRFHRSSGGQQQLYHLDVAVREQHWVWHWALLWKASAGAVTQLNWSCQRRIVDRSHLAKVTDTHKPLVAVLCR